MRKSCVATPAILGMALLAAPLPALAAPVTMEGEVSYTFTLLSADGGGFSDKGIVINDEGNASKSSFSTLLGTATSTLTATTVADPVSDPITISGSIDTAVERSNLGVSGGVASSWYGSQLYFFNSDNVDYDIAFKWDLAYSYTVTGLPKPNWDAYFLFEIEPMCGAPVAISLDEDDASASGSATTSCNDTFTLPAATGGNIGFNILNFGHELYAETIAPVPLPASGLLGLAVFAGLAGFGAMRRCTPAQAAPETAPETA